MNEAKLLLFIIFNGKPGGSIEESLSSICPNGIVAGVQQNAWMDDRTMKIPYETVLKVGFNNFDGCGGLLLGDSVCRKSNELKNRLQS